MNSDINVLHHLGIISHDLEAAVDQYERIGFVFAPLTIPRISLPAGGSPESIGAGNRCAIFRNNHLEVLGVVDQDRWNSITPEQRGPFDLDTSLSRYEGLHVLHLGTDDLEIVRARLQCNGLHPSEIRPFQRLVDTLDGPRMMRAKSLHFPPGSNSEALVQIAQHETSELVLQPRFMRHPFLAGFTVASDLTLTQMFLNARGIGFRMHDDRILVNAKGGYGAAILFENEDRTS
jgi:hypothetical protein